MIMMTTELSIEQGNKLIAEFLGWTKVGNRFEMSWTYYDDNGDEHEAAKSIKDTEFNYHSNWSQLMPVVEKIGDIPFPNNYGWTEEDYRERNAYPYPRTFGMKNKEGKYMVRLNAHSLFEADTLIEAAWLAVVDYIKS